MRPPMVGSWKASIVAARPYQIHGDNYFQLLITRLDDVGEDQPDAVLNAPSHAFAQPPEEGQMVEITFLMGQVAAVKVSQS